MFALDPKLQTRLRQHMSRVLIMEPNPAYARMLADMVRVLGADNIVIEADDRRAQIVIANLDPQLIITEYKTPSIDGIEFTKALRCSGGRCKAVPVILVMGDVTQAELAEARNAGIHEVLRKPFAWQDLLTRLQNVLFKPREWIEVASYTGPCRRSFNTGDFKGQKKRRGEASGAQRLALEEAVRMLKSSLDLFDQDAAESMKMVMQQMAVIVPACKSIKNAGFTSAVGVIVTDLRNKALSRSSIEPQINRMIASLGMDKGAANKFVDALFSGSMDEAEFARTRDMREAPSLAL